MNFPLRTADLNGPVKYVDFGGKGPPMVLVHGLGGSSVNWFAVGAGLARDHHVYAIDLPGFGRSPPGQAPPTIKSYRRLVARFIDEITGGPAVLVGNSMGGLIALAVAAKRRKLVSRLVLVSPALPRPAGARQDPRVFLTFVLYMVPGAGELFLRRRKAVLTPEQESDEILRLCTVDIRRIPPDALRAHHELARERRSMPWDSETFLAAARSLTPKILFPKKVRKWIESVRAPTLLIHGAKDRLVPVAASRETCRLRSDFVLDVLDDIGHVPQLEAPERFLSAVREFMVPKVERPT
jgi:pimeloyl-ACP methyl ester carboxylesterase